MKAKIYITALDNLKYFMGDMPTQRNGYCEIVRTLRNVRKNEFGGFDAIAKISGQLFEVSSSGGDLFDIDRRVEEVQQ